MLQTGRHTPVGHTRHAKRRVLIHLPRTQTTRLPPFDLSRGSDRRHSPQPRFSRPCLPLSSRPVEPLLRAWDLRPNLVTTRGGGGYYGRVPASYPRSGGDDGARVETPFAGEGAVDEWSCGSRLMEWKARAISASCRRSGRPPHWAGRRPPALALFVAANFGLPRQMVSVPRA